MYGIDIARQQTISKLVVVVLGCLLGRDPPPSGAPSHAGGQLSICLVAFFPREVGLLMAEVVSGFPFHVVSASRGLACLCSGGRRGPQDLQPESARIHCILLAVQVKALRLRGKSLYPLTREATESHWKVLEAGRLSLGNQCNPPTATGTQR